jgi:hypothetical protein
VTAILLGVIAGAVYPFIDLAWSCRVADSEACVWGKAYLPLTLAISIPLVGGIVAALAYAMLARRNKAGQ